jgi:hypothetical protein
MVMPEDRSPDIRDAPPLQTRGFPPAQTTSNAESRPHSDPEVSCTGLLLPPRSCCGRWEGKEEKSLPVVQFPRGATGGRGERDLRLNSEFAYHSIASPSGPHCRRIS